MWNVGIDVGGTFTDLFAWDSSGRQVTAKVLTTPKDRSQGVMNALREANIEPRDITQLMHGTTTATNALITRDFPRVAMITTHGFRDTIEIGRQHREELYNPYQTKPQPIIRRRYRYTINERMGVDGKVMRSLNNEDARAIARELKDEDIQSVAIAFINSYVNSQHEDRMREIVLEENPQIFCVTSSDTRPIFREHGRFTTTAIRAATLPVMQRYFEKLESELKTAGFEGRLLILKSSGGVAGVDYAKLHPEELIESGPAGGVAYAAYLSKLQPDWKNIIHTDVGGTSFDVSIVENGRGLVTRDHEIEWEVPCIVPMLDIHSVGAGGGSIGWVDEGGSLRAGPKSAGASPGPVCYRSGGVEPTITDANLLLGRIEPTLGGKFELDRSAASAAIERLAAEINLPLFETAEGMIRIACENMAQAVKKVLVSRGRDPRDFVLASFGGAGAMHACFVAESINIPTIIMPIHAGVASAFGATAMDLRQDAESFYFSPVQEANLAHLNNEYEELEKKALKLLELDGVEPHRIEVRRSAQMRYVGQTYEVDTPVERKTLTSNDLSALAETFHHCHEREYGVSSKDFAPAFVSLSVTAIGEKQAPAAIPVVKPNRPLVKGRREIFFDGRWHDSTVFDGHALAADHPISGPAIVEYEHACAVLPPEASAMADRHGNLVIDISRKLHAVQ